MELTKTDSQLYISSILNCITNTKALTYQSLSLYPFLELVRSNQTLKHFAIYILFIVR